MGWHTYVSENEPAYFAYSAKGWTDNELGSEYLEKVFEPETSSMYETLADSFKIVNKS